MIKFKNTGEFIPTSNSWSYLGILCKSMIFVFIYILIANSGRYEDFADGEETNVRLLKIPYPYSAALTIASDTHKTDLVWKILRRFIH